MPANSIRIASASTDTMLLSLGEQPGFKLWQQAGAWHASLHPCYATAKTPSSCLRKLCREVKKQQT